MRKVLLAALALVCLEIGGVQAQDIHFSQYWMSPGSLNPAMTGGHNGSMRAAINYRNQWWSIGSANVGAPTFVTYSGSFEYSLLRDKLDPDRFAVGIYLMGDHAGDGWLTTHNVAASIAYHKSIDRFGRNYLSLGLQAGFVQKRVFINDLLFETQLDQVNLIFDNRLPNLEPIADPNNVNAAPIRYPDANMGLMWRSAPTDNFRYYAGFAWFHIARPTETFLNDQSNRLDHRYSMNTGFEVDLSDVLTLSPSFLFMTQAKARQVNAGAALRYGVTPEVGMFFGVWSRFGGNVDAIIPTVGVDLQSGLRMGLSYDVNISDLKVATNSQGSIELAIIYVHNERNWRIPHDRYCPHF